MDNDITRNIVFTLMYLRRFLLETAIAFLVTTGLLYWFSPDILAFLQAYLNQKLAFFGVMEPILALLKLASVGALLLLAPWILWRVAQALEAVLGISRRFAMIFVFTGLMLFYVGAAFCLFVTLPFGIDFLLGYQSAQIRPVISIGKFINFVGFFLLGFGLIFELPLFMTLTCKVGLCGYRVFAKYRRYAILIIAIVAAVLTPTPDVVNMSLMALPLYLLYEAGILIARFTSPSSSHLDNI